MIQAMASANLLWAKWSRERNSYHPLLCHLIDVAVVTQTMWNDVLSPSTRRDWTQHLGLDDEDTAGCWIAFWAGLHDMGKASPAFQLKVKDVAARLKAANLPCPTSCVDAPHGRVSAHVVPDILIGQCALDRATARTVAIMLGGHHGSFPSGAEVRNLNRDAVGRGTWETVRSDLARRLFAVLETPRSPAPTQLDTATAMAMAGLVSVADWIGSNETYFPHEVHDASSAPAFDEQDYGRHARTRAAYALQGLGWLGWLPSDRLLSFRDLFAIATPRPLQDAVVARAPSLQGPGLVIVEAPTGEGKTEAALYLADYWSTAFGQRGMYVALPTMATSNQMFGRVTQFLRRRYPDDIVNTHLLHGHASLSEEYQQLQQHGLRRFDIEGIDGPCGTDTAPASVIAAQWFTARKRSLLAPFGVGTVDQALMTVLQVRHGFVRIFGLGRKTVILDEVHAYDIYMTTLMTRLIEWLGALHAPVVLLSATLPRDKRDRLARAYATGAGWPLPTFPPEVRYPRITWTAQSTSGSTSIATSEQSTREVCLNWMPTAASDGEDLTQLGARLAEELAEGGCAAVICNSVRRAQEVFLALHSFFPETADDGEPELDLLHARFLLKDRAVREQRVLRRFGKDSHVGGPPAQRRPRRSVLVATQIIEQSLDIDFDLMVTELAPADLLLQRAGRLYRHDRPSDRPASFSSARLWMMPLSQEEGLPKFGRTNEYIYARHILLRSWLALHNRDVIAIPSDVEDLVEAVYDERLCPADLPTILRDAWESSRSSYLEAMNLEGKQAEQRYIKRPASTSPLDEIVGEPREEDAPELHPEFQALTRLIEPTVSVVFLYGTSAQPAFDLHGREPVLMGGKLDIQTTRKLLRQSVTINSPGVVHALLATPAPQAWTRSPVLRGYRLLIMDSHHMAQHGTARIRIDDALGVVIDRDGEGGGLS